MIEAANSSSGVVKAVQRWGSEVVGESDAFGGWAYETGLQAAMGGELMVRAVELEGEADDGEPGTVSLERAFARNTEESFFGIPFDAAVEFFRSKSIMTPEQFDALRGRYRASGFASRTLVQQSLQERAFGLIEGMLTEGSTLREIATALRNDQVALGITPSSRATLNMVTRTNVATAYGHGRWEAMNDPAVVRLRPYMLFVTAGDVRVRPTHARLHMKVFRIGEDLAGLYAPPLGFSCRCSSNTLSQKALDRRSLTVSENAIANAGPDQGWEAPPTPITA